MKRAAVLVSLAGLGVSSAQAQDILWNNAAGGSWNTAGNWSPVNIPDSNAERAVIGLAGPYIVTLDGTVGVGGLELTGAGAELHIVNARVLAMRGDVLNNRLILVNPTAGGNATIFQYEADALLAGTGVVRLNANAGNGSTAILRSFGSGNGLRQAMGHSILGTGQVTGSFENAGLVSADISGRVLELLATTTNTGTLSATNGGTLFIGAVGVAQSGAGEIHADGAGSGVTTSNSSIAGGLVHSTAGGVVSVTGATVFSDVQTEGDVRVPNASVLVLRGSGLTNDGAITINPSGGGNVTILQMEADGALGGSGEVILNANPGNIDTALLRSFGSGNVVRHGADHTVRGTGNITGSFINEGLVRADQMGRTLQVNASVGNMGTMDATGGGVLFIIGGALTQSKSGVLRADNGEVQFQSAAINGGLLEAVNAGVSRLTAGATVFTDVHTRGPLQVSNACVLVVRGVGLTNEGTVTINTTGQGNVTILQYEVDGELAGPGTVVLNANPGNLDTALLRSFGSGNVVRHGAGHTVRGTGRITGALVNNGVVSADVAPGIDVAASVTNGGTMQAVEGATLSISGGATTNTAKGEIVGDGGVVSLNSASINGGTLRGINDGIVRNNSGDTVLTSVRLEGLAEVRNATDLVIRGSGLENAASLVVNPSSGGNLTLIQFETDGTLGGGGEVVLRANPANLDTALLRTFGSGNVIRHAADHTVRGNGRISGVFVNDGLVTADVNGSGIDINATTTNNNVMRAMLGSIMSFSGTSVTQGSGGELRAENGLVSFNSSSVTGGSIFGIGNGVARVNSGANVFTDVTLAGSCETLNNTTAVVRGSGLTNNGTLTINAQAGGNATILQFETNGTLGGTGSVILNANPANFDTAILRAFGSGNAILNAEGHTVGGRGRIDTPFTNAGRMAPGALNGGTARLRVTSSWTNTPTATISMDVAGTEQGVTYDHLQTTGTVTLDGTLRVRLQPGFIPERGASFAVITATSVSGTFDTLDMPELPPDYGYPRIEYTPTSVNVRIPLCRADWNGIDGGNSQDFFDFLTDFFGGDADYNRDGFSNSQDFFDFLVDFFRPCTE